MFSKTRLRTSNDTILSYPDLAAITFAIHESFSFYQNSSLFMNLPNRDFVKVLKK